MNPLVVENIYKRYADRTVLNGVSFEVRPGQCFGLLGPNGAGKTTTLRICLGLTSPESGSIRLLDFPIPEAARIARMKIGVVPQTDYLDPDFTVAENLLIYGRYFGIEDTTIKKRIPELLQFASLEGRAEYNIRDLSGGMKRRLTLARALINNPDLIFLDEPTTGLDPQARHLIWERLKSLLAQGKTILLTTHFMDEAERLCDNLVVMDIGKIVAQGSPLELIRTHIETEVLEVYGEGLARWIDASRNTIHRLEIAGETAFCYGEKVDALRETLSSFPSLRYLHRRANLEDVFLKLTGREMRD